jgi:hypothetical protein
MQYKMPDAVHGLARNMSNDSGHSLQWQWSNPYKRTCAAMVTLFLKPGALGQQDAGTQEMTPFMLPICVLMSGVYLQCLTTLLVTRQYAL